MQQDQEFFKKFRQPLHVTSKDNRYILASGGALSKRSFIFFIPALLMAFSVVAFLSPVGIGQWFGTDTNLPMIDKKNLEAATLFNQLDLTPDADRADDRLSLSQKIDTVLTKKDFTLNAHNIEQALANEDFSKAVILLQKTKQHLLKNDISPQQAFDKPVLIKWYDVQSEIASHNKDYKKAQDLSLKALEVSIDFYGKDSVDVAKHYEIIAFFYEKNGDIKKSLAFSHNALLIYAKHNFLDQGTLLVKMNNIGEKYRQYKDYDQASAVISSVIAFVEKKYGTMAPELAVPLNNLALVKLAQEEYTKAEAYMLRAHEISYKTQGANHHITQYIAKNLQKLQKKFAI